MQKKIKIALDLYCCGLLYGWLRLMPKTQRRFLKMFHQVLLLSKHTMSRVNPRGLGSGVVISTGVVATNHHVIDAAKKDNG